MKITRSQTYSIIIQISKQLIQLNEAKNVVVIATEKVNHQEKDKLEPGHFKAKYSPHHGPVSVTAYSSPHYASSFPNLSAHPQLSSSPPTSPSSASSSVSPRQITVQPLLATAPFSRTAHRCLICELKQNCQKQKLLESYGICFIDYAFIKTLKIKKKMH